MSLYANVSVKKAVADDWYAWPYIDSLYDYCTFIEAGPIAKVPQHLWGTEVAIIGAGPAGLVAAYELLKTGIVPVIYEASDKIGGRNYSKLFTDTNGKPSKDVFAEMGAMRFPLSNKLFFYYVHKFGLKVGGQFPDPGKVNTKLYFQNKIIFWHEGHETPDDPDFKRIGKDWESFVTLLTDALFAAWQARDMARVRSIWQSYIDKYKNMSFYAGVRDGIPQWSDEDMVRFGALGIGSGGFGPVYEVGFLEILRLIVNMWEDKQQLLVNGVSQLDEKFYSEKVMTPGGQSVSLQELAAVKFNTPVTAIQRGADVEDPIIYFRNPCTGKTEHKSYKTVIVATTTRSMEMMGMTIAEKPVISENVKVALRDLHMMSSSKMFIRTTTKFWNEDKSIPANIQTDELPRGIYCLDYPQTKNGVVVISYTWGDDSDKLLSLNNKERLELFKQSIRKVSSKFADNLVPVNDEILNIDWQREDYYYGAFKLQTPGQDGSLQKAYYQFLSVLDPKNDYGVYLAGDGVSWSGGWTEGALHTGLNAACAAAKRLGANLSDTSPLSQKPLYQY